MSLKWMWNGAPFSRSESATLQHAVEGLDLGEAAVGDRVQVGEVDHRPHPGELRGDREDVLGRAELADAAHHLDPERHAAALALEPLAQLGELLDDRGERLLARRGRAGSRGGGRRASRRPATATPAEWSSIPIAMRCFLSRSTWPMNPASGACTERTIFASRASSPKRSAHG